ncbi:hypothetical protein M3202_15520 [Alkalihalobacillus oceani]|uniref:DUF1659 domain-containing protein n=1 Tax=Halalkalibacter oceani TaxID=1653776 RepID=A0A9X2IRD7_9BACI|nr:hypothetical protein [Halalkalibacter oceani]MCM3715478.1 hypothetical protein [Halalkalibacter oceani]
MASKNPSTARLSLLLLEENEFGETSIRRSGYPVKIDAEVDALYDISIALSSLSSAPLVDIHLTEESSLA